MKSRLSFLLKCSTHITKITLLLPKIFSMLRKLSIQNYALIREIELDFDKGLNIITGETGAGKSIIIGALSLILGNRADSNVLLDKNRKCIVEAVFDFPVKTLGTFFLEHDLEVEEFITVRRQINPQGKSRAFINDIPVKLPVLRELSSKLIDINTQFQTYSLNKSNTQLQMLDAYAGSTKLLKEYTLTLAEYKKALSELNHLEQNEKKLKAELDFLQFQYDELEKLELKEGEYAQLEEAIEVMENAEEIKSKLYAAVNILNAEQRGVVDALTEALHAIKSIAAYHNSYQDLEKRTQSALYEIQDIASEMESLNDMVEYEPAKLEEYQERINLINHLLQKHSLQKAEDLIELKDNLEKQITSFENLSVDKESLRQILAEYFGRTQELADKLSKKRHEVIEEVERKVKEKLVKLGMASAEFIIELKQLDELNDYGKDSVSFLFSANKGMEVAPISKVASGGELSRLMLSLTSVLSSKQSLSSIVFDEIDTGVSGDIAGLVGQMMKEMGERMQIIAITHLPQIAAKAKAHFKVYKYENEGLTFSAIRKLTEEERVEEISMMISGKNRTRAAIDTARELMNEKDFQ